MANLRDRLRRIQEIKSNETPQEIPPSSFDISPLIDNGWAACGHQVLKREITLETPLSFWGKLPGAIAIVIPDLAGKELPKPEDFLFFDLETTGLSGGAGTVAFLAAFGRLVPGGRLCITQYLLLDYPGENDFLENVLGEFKNEKSVIVTYNGKCFDSQILKTRCLMNGIKPPVYNHADLLHPARRLWKNIIFDCSQGSIETRILGLDRSGDIPGALAPEIWFEFLKTGKTERLLGICDHNTSDIAGLASILAAMLSIADDPFKAEKYRYDLERLALYWRVFIRRHNEYCQPGFKELQITGNKFLRFAADKKYPNAAYVYALDLLFCGEHNKGRKRLLVIAGSAFPENIRAAAFRALAIDSERRLKDNAAALDFAQQGLELENAGTVWQAEFEKRTKRLKNKISF